MPVPERYPYPADLYSDDEGSLESDSDHSAGNSDDGDEVAVDHTGRDRFNSDTDLGYIATPPPEYSTLGSPPVYRASSTATAASAISLCIVCNLRPPFTSRSGQRYPTCGLTCAASLSAGPPQSNSIDMSTAGKLTKRQSANRAPSLQVRRPTGGHLMCIVCQIKPPYNKNGRAYPTCGLACAAMLSKLASSSSIGVVPSASSQVASTSCGRRSSMRPKLAAAAHDIGSLSQLATRDLLAISQQLVRDLESSDPQNTASSSSGPAPRAQGAGLGTRQNVPAKPLLPCVVCKARPAPHSYVTCCSDCGEELIRTGGDPTMCNYCHRRPRSQNHQQCGLACAEKAKHACLLCKCRPKQGRFQLCGNTCKRISTKSTPLVLEAPKGHSTYEMVERKFIKGWKTTGAPTIKKVYKIFENDDFLGPYNAYRKSVGKGIETYRYHGTRKQCQLGVSSTTLCTSTACSVCNILKTSFKVSIASPSGCFGAGIYSSSAANKAFAYTGGSGTLLLTKVVLGNPHHASGGRVTSCPAGYNSVVYDPDGAANETIVYTDDAIRPVFLITF